MAVPAASSEAARRTMQANRSVSGLERQFRQALWSAGGRGYRVRSRLPGRPDVVYTRVRLAVFIHGCYWHRCIECALPMPRANAAFWEAKFAANIERDRRAERDLAAIGWEVIVIWEHELKRDVEASVARVMSERSRRTGTHG